MTVDILQIMKFREVSSKFKHFFQRCVHHFAEIEKNGMLYIRWQNLIKSNYVHGKKTKSNLAKSPLGVFGLDYL